MSRLKTSTPSGRCCHEARQAVRKSNAGEELRELSERAKELLRSAQSGQYEAAQLRSTDLLAGIVLARHRWDAFLLEHSSAKIEEAARLVGRISRAISVGNIASNPEVSQKVLKSCHEVVTLLAEESGKMLKRLEGGAA